MCVCVRERELTYQLDRVDQSWDSPSSRDQRHRQHTQLPESLREKEREKKLEFCFKTIHNLGLELSLLIANAYLRAMSPDPT